MDLKDKTIMILGGAGMVGQAVARLCLNEKPKKLVITALKEYELTNIEKQLKKYNPESETDIYTEWGNIFVRSEFKDFSMREIVDSHQYRIRQIQDIMSELSPEILEENFLYQLIKKHQPHLIVDCVNTATAIAYMDVYSTSRDLLRSLESNDMDKITQLAEKTLCIQYLPLLVRHIQILYESLRRSPAEVYVKVGTSGTGGMGLNIPYTHSEEKPSRLLLSKSSIAGAQTLLLFLMGRTPDAPVIKEFKPTAAIGWREINHGPVPPHAPILLYDCPPENGEDISRNISIDNFSNASPVLNSEGKQEILRNVYINTGENGLFSKAEFEAITLIGQMEFITPEEIAQSLIYEVKGGNTGFDMINALDAASMGPTYRAGAMRHKALRYMEELEKEHDVQSIAFEMLGPPRLSKLLFEAYLLKLVCGTMKNVVQTDVRKLSTDMENIIKQNSQLRSEIISIGIPILLSDGRTLLRGPKILVPSPTEIPPEKPERHDIDNWSRKGWVDLRLENMEVWQDRIKSILDYLSRIPPDESSSLFELDTHFWGEHETIDPGKLSGWIFRIEEQGERWKR